jgi:hypothetical protein
MARLLQVPEALSYVFSARKAHDPSPVVSALDPLVKIDSLSIMTGFLLFDYRGKILNMPHYTIQALETVADRALSFSTERLSLM